MNSVHGKLNRVRKPRVHITYDVETEGAVEVKELPFVVGVMGDFSGHPTSKLASMKDRKFVSIDRDNISDVMKKMTPGLNLRVENTIAGDGSEMAVQLKFESMDDFDPANVAKQVDPLRKMLDTRDKLRDLLTKVDLSEDLEELLDDVVGNTEKLKQLGQELGVGASASAPADQPPADSPAPSADGAAGTADDAEAAPENEDGDQ